MQKKLIFVTEVLILTFILSGCANKSSVVLSRTEDFTVGETADVTAQEIALAEDASDSFREPDNTDTKDDAVSAASPYVREAEQPKIAVYVCGAVNNPGVYELNEGSRICDALDFAGGFSEDADETYVNLAAKLSDGTKLQIPTKEDTASMNGAVPIESYEGDSVSASTGQGGSTLININTATKEELKSLPGIGDGIAEKIIRYREEKGAFKSTQDIMKVSGIKDKLFSKIKEYITV